MKLSLNEEKILVCVSVERRVFQPTEESKHLSELGYLGNRETSGMSGMNELSDLGRDYLNRNPVALLSFGKHYGSYGHHRTYELEGLFPSVEAACRFRQENLASKPTMILDYPLASERLLGTVTP